MHTYLDETGNLIKGKENYFIVASYTIGNPERIAKAFLKWQKNKFPKILRSQSEVKFNDPHLTDDLRLKSIRYLSQQDIRIFYTFLKVKNIPEEYRKKGVVHETGLLYTEIVAATLELYFPLTEQNFIVTRDQRSLKGVTLQLFNEKLKLRLLAQLPAKTKLKIYAVTSSDNIHVQIADWICGALARFYENKANGQAFYEEMKGNIIEEKELFSDYWTKRWNK